MVFYHIYTLGFCGAPAANNFSLRPVHRLEKILAWGDHLLKMGVTAIYLGPVFESTSHGYDTVDYFNVDRRLGTNGDLKRIVAALHEKGIKVVLDAVFNHVGRDFWAFKHVRENLGKSQYASWFSGLNFGRKSPYQDPFSYDGWNGHYNLVKLNLKNPEVKNHLFYAVKKWVEQFDIDGLRLDSADCLDIGFITEFAAFCKTLKPDFWLLGEVIHGDYGRWVNAGLDSVTNYECYKGLWSSHNDANYFEIAYSLNRQFGENGLYRRFLPYNFADNHDVNRVASTLKTKAHLYPLYILLFTMPGIPSVYYGSEWGIEGKKTKTSDRDLRPSIDMDALNSLAPEPALQETITALAHIRQSSSALRTGNYQNLQINPQQLVFLRKNGRESVIVAVNSADQPVDVAITVPSQLNGPARDLLNYGESIECRGGKLQINIPPNWGKVLVFN
jgi:glycosidase